MQLIVSPDSRRSHCRCFRRPLAVVVMLARAGRGRRRQRALRFNSTDAILKWINAYRHRPDPDGFRPWCARSASMQAFKDAETSRRLCRLHRRRARRQSGTRRNPDCQDAADRAGRSLGAGARHRLFGSAELEGLLADLRRPHADAPRHDRQISRRQAADARSDRLPAGKARHARQDQSRRSISTRSARKPWRSSRRRS